MSVDQSQVYCKLQKLIFLSNKFKRLGVYIEDLTLLQFHTDCGVKILNFNEFLLFPGQEQCFFYNYD